MNTRDDYLEGIWRSELGNVPALVYPFCVDSHSLGNYLGIYFNEVACALGSGAHFISTRTSDALFFVPRNTTGDHSKFFAVLPSIIVNENPLLQEEVKKKMREVCKCDRFCWSDKDGPMFKNLPWTVKHVRNAIESYLSTINISTGTILTTDTDITTAPGSFLPIIPDVAIQ